MRWSLLMVYYGFIHSRCKLTLHFSHLKMVLLLNYWHRQYFDSPFTTTFKVSNFLLVPAITEMLRECAGRFLPHFPRVSTTSSRKNVSNGILFQWILRNNPQAFTAVAFIGQTEKATTTFWNGFAQDKLTGTVQINITPPIINKTSPTFALYSLKRFGSVTSTCFFSAFDQRFVDETGFSGKELVTTMTTLVSLSPSNEQIVSIICNQMFPWFPFEVQLFSLEVLLVACFLKWYPLYTYPCPSVYREVVT